ncbi:Ribulose-phosphate 3-epimerase [Dictyocoela muelleri]|nr:Ribulose-phosphate 3-epimerase [Dictyocoela muelleri]
MKTFISILDCNTLNLEQTLSKLKKDGVKNIHLDIIDTSFVDTISFGLSTINGILEYDFIFDLHFMVSNPKLLLPKIKLSKVRKVFIHSGNDFDTFNKILGDKLGIAVNPDENVEISELCDTYLLMGVYPGYGSQKYISVKSKINKLKISGKFVGVDGGINLETVNDVIDADFVVVGSAFFKCKDKISFINEMENK